VKIGMLGTAALVEQVRLLLAPIADRIPVVVDPVCAEQARRPAASTRGGLGRPVRDIVPLATVVTPNIPEAALMVSTLGEDSELTADDDGQLRAAALVDGSGSAVGAR
jgi:hydroxymethylpyrimidine/phosphomethylpyrimidine kinase